jgi:hypothetical protein
MDRRYATVERDAVEAFFARLSGKAGKDTRVIIKNFKSEVHVQDADRRRDEVPGIIGKIPPHWRDYGGM